MKSVVYARATMALAMADLFFWISTLFAQQARTLHDRLPR